MVREGTLPHRFLQIFDELMRIYKRSTYLLENGGLARRALDIAGEALSIVRKLLGVVKGESS